MPIFQAGYTTKSLYLTFGIFQHLALIHLLNQENRKKHIQFKQKSFK